MSAEIKTSTLIRDQLPALLGERDGTVSLLAVHSPTRIGDEGVCLIRFDSPERRRQLDQSGARMDHATYFFTIDLEGECRRVKLSWGHYDLNADAARKDFAKRLARGF